MRKILEGIVIVFALVFPQVARLPMFIYPIIVLGVIWTFLHFTGRSFADIGFRFKDFSSRSLIIGGAIGIAFALFVYAVLGPFILWATGLPPADLRDFYFIRNDLGKFFLLLALACFWVIPYEEIVFRGFILTTLRRWIGDTDLSFWIAGLIQCVLFAFYHIQEGYSAVIGILIGAVLTIWLYKIFKGNLWYLISFHCTYDIVMLNFVRLGWM